MASSIKRPVFLSKPFSRALFATALALLPMLGLTLFLELTRPVSDATPRFAPHLDRFIGARALRAKTPGSFSQAQVRHLAGVSAKLADASSKAAAAPAVSASEAGKLLAGGAHAPISVGYEKHFVAANGQRVILRVIDQQPIADEAVPDREHAFSIAPASSGNVIRFVWGAWRYSVEIITLREDPPVAVQKSL